MYQQSIESCNGKLYISDKVALTSRSWREEDEAWVVSMFVVELQIVMGRLGGV
jgi:hypothetical protein